MFHGVAKLKRSKLLLVPYNILYLYLVDKFVLYFSNLCSSFLIFKDFFFVMIVGLL
jgi:hypothetical protein